MGFEWTTDGLQVRRATHLATPPFFCLLLYLRFYFTKDCFSNRPDLDQIVPDESILLIGTIVALNRPRRPRADGF